MPGAPIKVVVLGLRGFPDIQGGIEKHAEQLYPRLASLGCHVCVLGRAPYKTGRHTNHWNRIDFHWLWAPQVRGVESLLHSLLAVVVAAEKRPDILHIHAIGPSLVVPLARLLGMKVVVTHHGKDYERQKWGPFARVILRLGERIGMSSANERIVISELIRNSVHEMYGQDSAVIPNGIEKPSGEDNTDVLSRFGLVPGKYVLQVSRIVPEKRQRDLIDAFTRAHLPPEWKLAFVGDTEFPDEYSRSVLTTAQTNSAVVCTGFQSGADLRELYRRGGLFVLPSSHEGLPIALLEAISHRIPVIASDIPANIAVGLEPSSYFHVGDTRALAGRLEAFVSKPPSATELEDLAKRTSARYDWEAIARETLEVYRRALE